MVPAVYIGAAVVLAGSLAAFAIRGRRRSLESVEAEAALELAA
jgi:hypothetical protein